jgi:hypothetical protein
MPSVTSGPQPPTKRTTPIIAIVPLTMGSAFLQKYLDEYLNASSQGLSLRPRGELQRFGSPGRAGSTTRFDSWRRERSAVLQSVNGRGGGFPSLGQRTRESSKVRTGTLACSATHRTGREPSSGRDRVNRHFEMPC